VSSALCLAGIAQPGTISPSPRPGRDDLPRLSAKTRRWDQAGCIVVPSDDQLNSVPLIHIRCRMVASFRATATRALLRLLRFAMRMPQALRADHFATRVNNTCRRDGTQCARLQSHARHEHSRYQAADGGDRGLRHQLQPLSRASETLCRRTISQVAFETEIGKMCRNGCVAARLAHCCPSTPPPPRYYTTKTHFGPRTGAGAAMQHFPSLSCLWR
jgi:hypothetical protein